MATEEFEECRIGTTNKNHCASEELCTFLATLINSEITSLTIPPLSTTQTDCYFNRVAQFCNHLLSAAGKALLSPEEFNKTFCGVPMLLDAIGTKCPSLKSLHMLPLDYYKTFIPLMKDNSLGDSFFKGVLPRLTVLNMYCYECDDWALMQIATHASSLV
jgi:hypothetical protein